MTLELAMSKRNLHRQGAEQARVVGDHLEEAWYDCIDALPPGWIFTGVRLSSRTASRRKVGMWYALAWTDGRGASGVGLTPGAALRDLARFLRWLVESGKVPA